MTKKNQTKSAADVVENALSSQLKTMINGEIDLNQENEKTSKYKIVRGVTMHDYNGHLVKANGILDESETVIAVAIARPGTTKWSSGRSNSVTRTPMFGDIEVYGFNMKEKKLGMRIMESKSWMVMQSKSPSGEELRPFIRTPWDVKQSIVSQTGRLQPPTMDQNIRTLCDAAINMAAIECNERIRDNKPSQTQESYSPAVEAAVEMAHMIMSRTNNKSVQRSTTSYESSGEITSAAANLLND